MAVVVDASAFLELLLRKPAAAAIEAILAEMSPVLAPELLDAEVLSVLARLDRQRLLSRRDAERILDRLLLAPIVRVPHRRLVKGAWKQRGNVGSYDALYMALAAEMGCPLVTRDRRLAAAPRLPVEVLLVPP